MYDELERSVTGRPPRRMSILGWLLIGVAVIAALGVGGSVWAFHVARARLAHLTERLTPEAMASHAVSGMIAHAFAAMEPTRIAMDPHLHRELLTALQSDELDQAAAEDVIEGAFRLRTDEGAVTADLRGNEEGGSLVIASPEGEVRFDLVRHEDGGGELVLRADGETVRLGAGGSAHDLPAWMPRVDGMSDSPKEVLSARSGEGDFAIVTWETDQVPEELLASYRSRLEGEGYEVRAEHALRMERGDSGSIIGKDEANGRVVFLAASRDEAVTRAVLGYGEGGPR